MKKYIGYLSSLLFVLTVLQFMPSCDSMNDIQSKYADLDEKVYLGKVDSLKSIPGFGRAMVTWYIGSDPKIEQTVIKWNMGEDSLVKNFVRIMPGVQKDSMLVENLEEGSLAFEFYNKNSRGETSLPSSITVTVWGAEYADQQMIRRFIESEFDYENSEFSFSLSKTNESDNLIYSEIIYKDKSGLERTMRVERDVNNLTLENFPDGESVRIRSIFFLQTGIDTLYSSYSQISSPTITHERGKRLSIGGGSESEFFNVDDKAIGEWTKNGDIKIYSLGEDNSFTLQEEHVGIAPHDNFRVFFYYDDNKYLAIDQSGRVSLVYIDGIELVSVGGGSFGTGFTQLKYIPARGFFYSLNEANALQTWLANNNASWGTPNGTTIKSGFTYDPAGLFRYRYLLGVDEIGDLWAYQITTTGAFGIKSKNGGGWDRFAKLFGVGNQLIAIDNDGVLWQFQDFDLDHYWIVD